MKINLLIISVVFVAACSKTEFASNSQFKKKVENVALATKAPLIGNFHFIDGATAMNVTVSFSRAPSAGSRANKSKTTYAMIPGSLKATPDGAFPEETAQQLGAGTFVATITHPAAAGGQEVVQFDMDFPASSSGAAIHKTVSQTSASQSWSKDEGPISDFQTIDVPIIESDCSIKSSGNQPREGVYAVILTNPAPCDFRMPTVKISDPKVGVVDVAIGTYWIAKESKSHPFPLTPGAQSLFIDDGYILIQPDHKSYLLVDAGYSKSAEGGEGKVKFAATIAKAVSATLGFGDTTLMQPVPGSAADNYATGTVFKAGSVIILYDDTPDMHGTINVEALTVSQASVGGSMSLKWDASLE